MSDRTLAESIEELLGHLPPGARGELSESLLRRTLPALGRALEHAPSETLKESLSASTDIGSLSRLLASSTSQEGVRNLDPLADAFARGAARQEELLDRAGGVWTAGEVAEHLDVSRQAVDGRRRRGSLLAVQRGDRYYYPLCQFDETGVIDGLDEVLRAIEAESGWTKLSLLFSSVLTGEGTEGEEETVLDAVRSGHLESALHAARTWGTQGAA